MANDISLTVRLPHELNEKLQEVAKAAGFTKTNLIRIGIHHCLVHDKAALDFEHTSDKKDRLVLNVNQLTYRILEDTCKEYGQSMNAVITAVSALTLEYASKWLL